jgi:WD40 repeat protein
MPIKYVFSFAVFTIIQLVLGLFLKTQLSPPKDNTISTPSAFYIVERGRYGENDRADILTSADESTLVYMDNPAHRLKIIDAETSASRSDINITTTNGLIRLSPDGRYLSMTDVDTLIIWDTAANTQVGRIVPDFDSPIQDIIWSQDSGRVLLTTASHEYQAFNLADSTALDITLGFNQNEIVAMAWDSDNSLIGIAMIDESPRIISSNSQQFALDIELPTDISTISAAPHDDLLVYGTESGEVGLVDVVTGEIVKTFEGHTAAIVNVQWSPVGKQFVSTDADGLQIVWGIPSN